MEEWRLLMEQPAQLRHVILLGHVDHGKSTLADALFAAVPAFPLAEGVPIRAAVSPIRYSLPPHLVPDWEDKRREHLVNLITPPPAESNAEIQHRLAISDGALAVVDSVEGVAVSQETQLRQALAARVAPVLFVNKLDRYIRELQLNGEEAYRQLERTVESFNVICATYADPVLPHEQVFPEKGSVVFGSALHLWGFTIPMFARMYAKKFGVAEDRMAQRLWGDNYFDPESKCWLKTNISATGKPLTRAFSQFVWTPLQQLTTAARSEDRGALEKMLQSLGIRLEDGTADLTPQQLERTVISRWLPIHDAVLPTLIVHLPSPVQAQRYKTELLYTGPADDMYSRGCRACDL